MNRVGGKIMVIMAILVISSTLLMASAALQNQSGGLVYVEVYEPVNYDLRLDLGGDVFVLFGGEDIFSLTDRYLISRSSVDGKPCLGCEVEQMVGERLPGIEMVSFHNDSGVLEIYVVWSQLEKDSLYDAVSSLPSCVSAVKVYATLGDTDTVEYLTGVLGTWQSGEASVINQIDGEAVRIFSKYGEIETFYGLHASVRMGPEMTLSIVVQADIRPSLEDIEEFVTMVREAVPGDYPLILAFNKTELSPLVMEDEASGGSDAAGAREEGLDGDVSIEESEAIERQEPAGPIAYLVIILIAVFTALIINRIGR